MPASAVSVFEGQSGLGHQEASAESRLIARSPAMREILDRVQKISCTSVPVLIHGEIGVGKAALAREIHRRSPRAAGPFVRVACGSLREPDLDAGLFSSPAGCRAGGSGTPAGLVEVAEHGTLFLDGVGQLPLWAQAKLFDALQRTGAPDHEDGASVPSGARVVASTTFDLQAAVLDNRFDSKLYYALSFVRIDVSPLRYRQEDIRALAEYFLAEAEARLGPDRSTPPRRFSEEAWQCLLQYDWPGNVAQLEAVVAHAAALAEGPEIGAADVAALLCAGRQSPDSERITVPLAGSLKQMERALIREVIGRCRGNKTAAARALGLHRRTLYRLLEE